MTAANSIQMLLRNLDYDGTQLHAPSWAPSFVYGKIWNRGEKQVSKQVYDETWSDGWGCSPLNKQFIIYAHNISLQLG